MSDDEEVVLANSELHKHILSNNNGGLTIAFVDELCVEHSIEANKVKCNLKDLFESTVISRVDSFELSENASNIICVIFKTGLMYPDHIIDLESKVDIKNITEKGVAKTNMGIYCLCLIASSSVSVITNKFMKALRFIGLASAAYFSYKMYYVIKECYDSRKIKRFASTIEQLFLATKKALTLIIESEFLLRSKIMKEQPFYVPSNGWVNPNSYESLNYSGLILPELRKTLISVHLDAIGIFDNLLIFMKKMVPLKCESDKYNFELLDDYVALTKQNVLAPGSDDLKKLNNMYLVRQSEFLYHFILCFIERIWVNKSSYYSLKLVILEVIKRIDSFSKLNDTLEIQYQKCIYELKSNTAPIRGNSLLKSSNANDKLYIFIKNVLTKADAHMLSLVLDLRMINDYVKDFEENNKDSGYSTELIITLHDRLEVMKSNILSFSNLYNDNCNVLKSMICSSVETSSSNNVNAVEDKLNNSIRLTGIEVGKTNFDYPGGDEVLISLSNADNISTVHDPCSDDFDDFVTKKCLPKSVLNELNFALKVKKQEWLEREKKATLNSDVTIDNLDLDNLLHSNEQDCIKKTASNHKQICRKKLTYRGALESDYNCSSDEECTLVNYVTAIDIPFCEDNGYVADEETFKYNDSQDLIDVEKDQSVVLFTNAAHISCSKGDVEKSQENEHTLSLQSDSLNSSKIENSTLEANNCFDYDSVEEVSSNNSVCRFSTPNAFVNQIVLAQKSFNLNMREEEFFKDSSDEEIQNDI